ncbi:cytochrome P450 89A2-like [Panicum miliaceum]|uniref:Cytochrome P450 89A2-like n=1 Tax=Panicum miliaceum TaxID=4540 RepID=A0A3L6RHP4_PANMI|nr:cytochrome P450 89A2-like [Panicum miliaceum]
MEDWLYYSLSIAFCLALSLLSSSLQPATGTPPAVPSLPPGPTALLAIGPLLLLGRTSFGIDLIIRTARSWYGPIFTIYFLSTPVIFVADREVARRVLVQRGAAFADRPPANLPTRIFTSDQRTIISAAYGPLWRVLRLNLAVNVLHPSSLRRHAAARRSAVSGLIAGVALQMRGEGTVVVEGLLHRAMWRVAVIMCFGDGLGDAVVASVTDLQREFLASVVGFQVFGAVPAITKLLFRRRFKRMLSIRRRQEELLAPLIRARRARRDAAGDDNFADEDCYADSLLSLRIPEDGGSRNLTESEMVCLCSEFLTSTTDSTAAVTQWIMAHLVAQPEIQAKLRAEIRRVVTGAGAGVEDEHLRRMPYLRAVVLEGLRRHPPTRFTVPHAATEEAAGTTLDGFSVPRHAPVNFTLAGMGLDEAVWPDARRFRPERFLPGGDGEGVDLTGGKEIKMMPFGAGRRMCPGVGLALLHLEYFVANLVREFEWKEAPGEPVEFAERLEMSLVMKRPLRAIAVPYTHAHNWS